MTEYALDLVFPGSLTLRPAYILHGLLACLQVTGSVMVDEGNRTHGAAEAGHERHSQAALSQKARVKATCYLLSFLFKVSFLF